MLAAVLFDLDGVLLDSEAAWSQVREQLTISSGGHWSPEATRAMMGMSSIEWSAYMHDTLGVPESPREISEAVVRELQALYRRRLPLIDGAHDAVRRLADAGLALALASSANRPLIDLFLELADLGDAFAATVSSEEVPRGKPAPDVYLEAARRLGTAPGDCAAVEDSSNGLRSAAAAGTAVIAVPNRDFPPDPDALALADLVLGSVRELTPARLRELARSRTDPGSPRPA